jgi:heme-degrading monooxygenase HmoA
MHGRVIRMKGDPAKTDEGIKLWTQNILPLIKKQKGFAGVSLMGSRKTGDGLSVTYWETEQAMKEARPQVRPEAEKMMGTVGRSIVEENECEVVVQERFKPPKSGTWVRITTVEGDPARINDGIADYRSKVVPNVQKQPGARAAILLVDRKAGKSFSGTVWDTEKDLQNSDASLAAIRQDIVKKIGGKGAAVDVFEIFYTEILAPVVTR